jgi:enoyl-[acyl-carrier protein] reductase I
MLSIDLTGKIALVTGVGDNDSFAWTIAKHLQAAGCRSSGPSIRV